MKPIKYEISVIWRNTFENVSRGFSKNHRMRAHDALKADIKQKKIKYLVWPFYELANTYVFLATEHSWKMKNTSWQKKRFHRAWFYSWNKNNAGGVVQFGLERLPVTQKAASSSLVAPAILGRHHGVLF